MARAPHVDISNSPALLRLAEEVRASNKPRVLSRDREPLVVVSPVRKARIRKPVSEADYQAFLSSLGSWKDIVDVDKFLRDNEDSRSVSIRPPVEL